MNVFAALMANRFRMTDTALRRSGWAQRLIAACFFVIGLAIIVGAYLFFRRAFAFILIDKLAGPIILRYALETAFALTYFLGVASFIVASHSLILRADDVTLLVTMPVPPGTLYAYRFVVATVASSWPVVLLMAPALAALGTTLGASWEFALFGAAIAILFAMSVAVIGGLLSFLTLWLLRPLRTDLRKLTGMIAFAGFGVLLVRQVLPRQVFTSLIVSTPAEAAAATAKLRGMFAFFPSHPFAQAAASLLPYGGGGSGISILLFAVATIVLGGIVLVMLATKAFLPLWQRYGENGFIASSVDRPTRRASSRPFPRVLRLGHSFLFEKDALTFMRDGDAVARAGFLIALLVVYMLVVRGITLAHAYDLAASFTPIMMFAFATIGYFILTFTMRFVFPALSLEGKGAWLEWSSPIHAHEIFSWKVFFWSTLIGVIMEAVAAVVVILFGLTVAFALTFAYAVLLATVSIVTMGLATGALAPNFRAKDPDMIATSPSGLAMTGLGIGYLWVMTQYLAMIAMAFHSSGTIDAIALAGMTVVSLAAIVVAWALARHRMDHMEII